MHDTIARIRTDQRRQLAAGKLVPIESYVDDYPALTADPDTVLDLIYSEVLLREEYGQVPGLEEYIRRFPQYAIALTRQFELHSLAGGGSGGNAPALLEGLPDSVPPCVPGYLIEEELGRGYWGVVYAARQVGVGRRVAVKVLRPDRLQAQGQATLRRDAEVAGRISHRNIAQVYDCGEYQGVMYVILELVEGGSLADRLAAGPLPSAEAARVLEAVARAAHQAHLAGVVHRDLKPANVLLTLNGTPKVTDFGLAKRLDGTSSLAPSGAMVGTWQYMSPEQAAGATREVGPAADVWAIGVVLHELLTGQPPFRSPDPVALLRQVRDDDPPPLSRRVAPRDLDTIRRTCLEKAPGRRYSTAEALADDLCRFLAGERVCARPRPWPMRVARRVRSRLILLAAVVGLAAVVIATILRPDPVPEVPEVPRPTTTEEIRDEFRAKLEAGEPIELLKIARPGPFRWVVGGPSGDGPTPTEEGLTIEASGAGLVEILPSVPCDRFRLTVELRMDRAPVIHASHLGLYFGFRSKGGGRSGPWAAYTVSYSEQGKGLNGAPGGPGQTSLGRWFVRGGAERSGEFSEHSAGEAFRYVPSFPINGTGPWRQLTIDVGPTGATARWGPETVPPGAPVSARMWERLTGITGKAHQLAGVPAGYEWRGGVGLFVSGCRVTFRRVALACLQ